MSRKRRRERGKVALDKVGMERKRDVGRVVR